MHVERKSGLIDYRGFGIVAHNPEVGYPFAEILDSEGDHWDDTDFVETTQAAVRVARRKIDKWLNGEGSPHGHFEEWLDRNISR